MGNDGGSIAKRDELVKVKAAASKADPAIARRVRWTQCRLSRQPLREPVVADELGRMYNKEAVLKWMIEKKLSGGEGGQEAGVGHIRGLKDLVELKLHRDPAHKAVSSSRGGGDGTDENASPYSCPLTGKPMNGTHRFVYIRTSGAVISESGLKAIVGDSVDQNRKSASSSSSTAPSIPAALECPVTSVPFQPGSLAFKNGAAAQEADSVGDVILLNPSSGKEEDLLRESMVKRRESEPRKKSKQGKKDKTGLNGTGAGADAEDIERLDKKRKRLVQEELATVEEEPPSKAVHSARHIAALAVQATKERPMSSAVGRLYGHGKSQDGDAKESWLVRGTAGAR